jgi:hypothetical protein
MTVINPQSGLVQVAADFTAGRALEVYETDPHFAKGTGLFPFRFSAPAGTTVDGAGAPTIVTLPYYLPASLLQQWTPYIRVRREVAGAAAITVTFSFVCSPDGTATYAFPMMNATLPVPALLAFTLDTEAGGGTAYMNYRLPPIQGCDGLVKMVVSNPGAAHHADDIIVIASAEWRP